MNLTAIIIDDEQDAISLLQDKLYKWQPFVKVVAKCADVKEAMLAIVQYKPDVLFLDIYMPGMNGLEFFRYVRDLHLPSQCIIITAYKEPEYFQEAIRLGLTDYLLKPVIKEELTKAIENVSVRIAKGKHNNHFSDLTGALNKITLPIANGVIRVAISDIIYARSTGKFTEIWCDKEWKEVVTLGITEFEKLIVYSGLQRIDRFTIVNPEYVQKVSLKLNRISFATSKHSEDVIVSKVGAEKMMELMKIN